MANMTKLNDLLEHGGLATLGAKMTLKYNTNCKVLLNDTDEPTSYMIFNQYWCIPFGFDLEEVIIQARLLDYRNIGFPGVDMRYYDAAKKSQYLMDWESLCHLYVYEGPIPDFEVPTGYQVVDLKETDAPLIDSFYQYKNSSSLENIEKSIRYRHSVGILNDQGQLVSWVIVHDDGTMGIMYTLESHRKLGLGKVASLALIRKQMESDLLPYVHIVHGNQASIALAESMGMVKKCDVAWFGIEIK